MRAQPLSIRDRIAAAQKAHEEDVQMHDDDTPTTQERMPPLRPCDHLG